MLKFSKWIQYLKFILELPFIFVSYYAWIMYNPIITSCYFKTAWFKCIDCQTVTLIQVKQLNNWTDSVKYLCVVRSEADVGASVKTAAFWKVMSCGLIEIDWHFRGTCIHHQGRIVPYQTAGITTQKIKILILTTLRASQGIILQKSFKYFHIPLSSFNCFVINQLKED
jgi:hypothetical protein